MILRSLLFVPGNRIDRVEKAFASSADGVIIDLEDAVAISEKDAVRDNVGAFLEKTNRKNLFIRVNGVETPFFNRDIEVVTQTSVCGMMIPKAESAESLQQLDQKLGEIERKRSIPDGQVCLVPLIETALGLSKACEIGSSTARVLALAFGAADFTLDLGAQLTKTGEEILFARSSLVLASRLAGVYAIDSPYMIGIKDIEALRTEARLARQLGFRGKVCIHPCQVESVNHIFSPTQEEVAKATRITEAFELAKSKGESAVLLNGQFIDPPIYEKAKQVLEFAKEIEKS